MSYNPPADYPSDFHAGLSTGATSGNHPGGFASSGYQGEKESRSLSHLSQQPMVARASSTIQNTVGTFEGVSFRIDHRDSNTLLSIALQPGYQIQGKPGAMVAMSASVQIRGKMKFGFKKMFTSDDMTYSTFTGPGEVLLAPKTWGDVVPIYLDCLTDWNVSRDAFLACTTGVTKTSKSQSIGKAMFSGEGLYVHKVSGIGIIWIQSLGAIVQKQLAQGEQWIVDNGHLVAWTARYNVERIDAGGYFSGSRTGEGMVCRFTGPGTVFIQTRSPSAIRSWIVAQVPHSQH
ncbi:hypothetical protein FRC03_012852 [Tulasnella sp. 419]|nr:hypothetical protein FRC03_012852 [Tulasnella sp. 419]